MAEVMLMGLLRLRTGCKELTAPAVNIAELIKEVSRMCPELSEKELRQSVIFVGDKNITELKMFRTKLGDNAKVIFMSPVSGG